MVRDAFSAVCEGTPACCVLPAVHAASGLGFGHNAVATHKNNYSHVSHTH